MKVRLANITIEDCPFTIGGLTLAQVEEFIAPDAQGKEVKDLAVMDVIARNHNVVIQSLNNAIKAGAQTLGEEVAVDALWTDERLKTEMDSVVFQGLFEAVLLHCKMKLAKVDVPADAANPGGAPGESLAAPKS